MNDVGRVPSQQNPGMTTQSSDDGAGRDGPARAFVVDMQVTVTVDDEQALREYAHARIDEAQFVAAEQAESQHAEVELNLAAAVRFVVGPRGAAGFAAGVPGLRAHTASHSVSEQPASIAREWL